MKAIEIGLILIVLLVISSVILNSAENSTRKVVGEVEANHMEKITSEVLDNLINNPGVPENWNEYDKGTPGLAVVNDGGVIVPNSVSYSKFISLGKNYDKLITEKTFDSKIRTSMELQPIESIISSVKIGDLDESDEIFSISRLVKCDFYKSYVIKDFQNPGKCNKHHDQSKNSCNSFKIFKGNLKKSDYYLLIDDGETYDLSYIIGSTRLVKTKSWQTAISNAIYLNSEIEFYDDTSAVVFVHLDKPHAKALIVSVPKDFDKNLIEYDYFRTNDCNLILKGGLI